MLKLSDLPNFTISKIEPHEKDVLLHGRISKSGSHGGRAWLYVSKEKSIIGDLAPALAVGEMDGFTAPRWAINDLATVGAQFPIIDGYWNAYQIAMILDEHHVWQRQRFAPSDAIEFTRPGNPGWTGMQKVATVLPVDATQSGVVRDAWDHEHCDICWRKIGQNGEDFGYRDLANRWLCETCFHSYAEQHDLSFLRS